MTLSSLLKRLISWASMVFMLSSYLTGYLRCTTSMSKLGGSLARHCATMPAEHTLCVCRIRVGPAESCLDLGRSAKVCTHRPCLAVLKILYTSCCWQQVYIARWGPVRNAACAAGYTVDMWQRAGMPPTSNVQLAGTTPLAPTAAAHAQQGAEHEGCIVLVFSNVCVLMQPKGLWRRIDGKAVYVLEVGFVGPCKADQRARGQASRRHAHRGFPTRCMPHSMPL